MPQSATCCDDPWFNPCCDTGIVRIGACSVSGIVTDSGVGLAGVTMGGFPEATTTLTDGTYTGIVPCGWSGIVTPSKIGYTFMPPTRSHVDVLESVMNQNFVTI